jgi:hypothetical protein
MHPEIYNADCFYQKNKWGVRVIKRGQDNDSALVAKCLNFPNEEVLARAMWPDQAQRLCDEHNDALAKILFPQNAPPL